VITEAHAAQTSMSISGVVERLRERRHSLVGGGGESRTDRQVIGIDEVGAVTRDRDRSEHRNAGLSRGRDARTSDDVHRSTGRLLSIAQLQSQLRTGMPNDWTPSSASAAGIRPPITEGFGIPMSEPSWMSGDEVRLAAFRSAEGEEHSAAGPETPIQPSMPVTSADGKGCWVLVVAAQSGAGCSTTALAVADAAGRSGSRVHLVEAASGGHGSLAAVTRHELGLIDGGWRRGRRGPVVVDRPITAGSQRWPSSPPVAAGQVPLMVLDAGPAWAFPGADPDGGSAWWRARAQPPAAVIVVCRATVPGVMGAERALYELVELHRHRTAKRVVPPVVVASVGGARWRGAVGAACGPHLQEVLAQHRVVGVPRIRRLEVSGPTADPLPRALSAAGRVLWSHVEVTPAGNGVLR
jgi:hypothetical protein